jgi:hypothetical protein
MLAQETAIGMTNLLQREILGPEKTWTQNDEDCVDEAKKKSAAVLRPYNIEMNGF